MSAALDSTGGIVRDTVRDLRAAGLKSGAAQHEAARRLGLTARRVRAYVYNEVEAVPADEYLRVRARLAGHLAQEARRLAAAAALLDARRAALALPDDDQP